jgi:hypothetical protein
MEKVNRRALKNIISLDSWKEAKKIFIDEANNLTSNDNIPSSWTDKQIAIQVKANKKAREILLGAISKIEQLGTDFNKENESFK